VVIDSSAIVAILLDEPEKVLFVTLINRSSTRLMSVASLVEITIALESKRGTQGRTEIDALIKRLDINIESVDLEQGEEAREGFRRYGRGRHPAALNFGDCFSYALAITRREPLLFKGTDFAKTDVMLAAEI